jgi:hypothetical protein
MKNCILLLYLLSALAVPRAAAQGVYYTFDKHVNFYNYKTYKWVTIDSGQRLDDLTADQLIATLDVELAKKGLAKADSDPPDLYIGYQIARNNDRHFSQYNVGGSSGSAAGATSATAGATIATVHSGQLVLDLYDASKKQLVWRGVVPNAIDANATPEKKQKHMDKAVERLLKEYPPKKT